MAKVASYEDFIKDTVEDKIIDYKNPSCSNCNECCSMGTVLTEEEYLRLKKYLKTDKEGKATFKRANELILSYRRQNTIYFLCPFSTKNRRCSIYSMRPNVCKDFHCSPELAKNYDRETLENYSDYNISDLFMSKK